MNLILNIKRKLGDGWRFLFQEIHLASSIEELKQHIKKVKTCKDIVLMTESYRGKGYFAYIKAWQVMSEFEAMLEEVKKRRPERILEIGTARGATLLGWCQIAQKQVISIDLEGGIHGGGYLPVRKKLYQEFKINNEGIDLYMLQKNSQINETVAEVRSLLKGQLLDVLFIDGDHRYAGIKKDFELWSPLVRSGGVILFHDIARHTRTAECEVDVFWNEIKTGYENIEWIENAQQGWAGIGMLVKP